MAGRRYQLRAAKLGSVSRGSPIYYRDVQVGQVLTYELAEDKESMIIDVFVAAPHDQLVRANSRFWNASGLDVSVGAEGVSVSVESLQALLAGGIAFDTPAIDRPGAPAAAGTVFPLFENFTAVTESRYTADKVLYEVYFDGSVRGLRAGAAVEFRGMRIGSVTDVKLEIDPKQDTVRIPVTLGIEPARITMTGGALATEPYAMMRSLVGRGLRAQLKSANLLTGDLLVDLDFHPESPPAKLGEGGTYPVIPSVPTQLEVLTASITGVLNKLATLPLPELVADLRGTVQTINGLVASPDTKDTITALRLSATHLQTLLASLDQRVGPLLAQADSTLASAQTLVGHDLQLRYDLGDLLKELTGAARSVRVFADYLERHPEALLRGKAGAQ